MTSTETTPRPACIGPSDAMVIDWMTKLNDTGFNPGALAALIVEAGQESHGNTYGANSDVVLGIATSRGGYLARLALNLAARVDKLAAELADANERAARLEGQLHYLETHPRDDV